MAELFIHLKRQFLRLKYGGGILFRLFCLSRNGHQSRVTPTPHAKRRIIIGNAIIFDVRHISLGLVLVHSVRVNPATFFKKVPKHFLPPISSRC
jgi:hypothetical protein